jgi:amidase
MLILLMDNRTTNPLNRNLTSGGSSGGESALIAMRGSPLGVGTDIGGSLRIPAACTGIYTIRPSYGRFPHFDARSGLAGQESIGSVHGPMARSIADLRLFTDNVANASPWLKDPKCIPMPWRSVELKSKPKIGVLWDNGMVHPTPPVTRALKTVVDKLKSKGYDIVDWPATGHEEANTLVGRFFVADGGKSVKKILEPVNEPVRPEMAPYSTAPELGVYDLWQLQKQRTALQKMYLDRWAACEGLDAILGPTTPYAAPKAGCFKTVSYTGIFNLLDYSSTSFPTGVVGDKGKDVYEEGFQAFGDVDRTTREDYDPAEIQGIPVSLQLTGRRLEDEKILALTAKVCEDIA